MQIEGKDNTDKKFDFKGGEIFVFDKPLDWTSFDVVGKVRWKLCRKLGVKKLKVGHAGTLDPKATGVLVLCTGKSTKLIDGLQAQVKEYVATLKLGATTPSFDLETEEDASYPVDHISKELIDETLKQFIGPIQQIPPVYSAVKVNGKRAYEYARKGADVELKAKLLVIDEIEVVRFEGNELELRIVCSKGTYIRALARDIGKALNSGAYLTGLLRSRVGNFTVENAYDVEEFCKMIDDLDDSRVITE